MQTIKNELFWHLKWWERIILFNEIEEPVYYGRLMRELFNITYGVYPERVKYFKKYYNK